jgi:aspartate racemase
VKAGDYALALQRFETVSQALQQRHAVGTLIMGCTEIPLALAEGPRLPGLSLVNPSVVLASALARHACRESPALC